MKSASSPFSIAMMAFSTPVGKPRFSPSPISNFNSLSSKTRPSQEPSRVTEKRWNIRLVWAANQSLDWVTNLLTYSRLGAEHKRCTFALLRIGNYSNINLQWHMHCKLITVKTIKERFWDFAWEINKWYHLHSRMESIVLTCMYYTHLVSFITTHPN